MCLTVCRRSQEDAGEWGVSPPLSCVGGDEWDAVVPWACVDDDEWGTTASYHALKCVHAQVNKIYMYACIYVNMYVNIYLDMCKCIYKKNISSLMAEPVGLFGFATTASQIEGRRFDLHGHLHQRHVVDVAADIFISCFRCCCCDNFLLPLLLWK